MNPFELRFNILHTAKTFLEEAYKANKAAYDLMDKASKEATELAPKYPTMEEVIDKAIEINKFISETQVNEFTKVAKRLTGAAVIF